MHVTKEVQDLVISMADSEKGYKNNQIADLMNISESCVKDIIRKHNCGIEYESTAEKRKDLSKEK